MNYSSKLSLVLLLLLVSGAGLVSAQDDIDGTLKANNITSTKWIEAQDNLIVNTSINRVYLNMTGFIPSLENFTLYTEYEESGDLITINNATFITARCDLYYGRYVYYDFGTDFFENFTIRFACYMNGIGATGLNDHYYFILHENTVSDAYTLTTASDDYYMFRLLDDTSQQIRVLAYTKYGGTNYHNGWTYDNNLDFKWLYVEIVKDGPDIDTTIYNYANYTDVYWTDSLTLPGSSTYRYLYPINSQDLNLYPGYYLDMYIKDLDIGSGGGISGNLYTSNLLGNETSKEAYSVLYEGVETASTSLECFVSENNSTWTEVVERGELLGGLDPCYLWFRLNSTDVNETPYLDYYHIFFEDSFGGGGLNYTQYNCSSFLNVTGSHFSGNLTSLQEVDSDICYFNETTGTPGFDIRFNFTGIPDDIVSLRLEAYGFYEGNPAHVVNYQIYNHDSGSWETLDTMGEGAWEWLNVSLSYNTTNYLNDGNLTMRYYHSSPGSVGHWLGVDYIKVSGYNVVGVSETPLNPWDINWLTALIWLALLSIGYLNEARNIKLFSGVVGIVFGLLLLNSVNTMVGVIVLCVSFYLLYEGTGTK